MNGLIRAVKSARRFGRREVYGLCAVAAAWSPLAPLATTQAQAQEVLNAPLAFEEAFVGGSRFSPRTQSALGGVGRLVVGVRLGRPSEEAGADIAALRVAVPGGAGDRLCVTLSTSDGSYSARSDHTLEGAYAAPPQLGLATEYADALGAYTEAELLVSARRAEDCAADAGGVSAPAVAQDGATELVVSINIGRGRPKAWLERGGAPVTDKARCRRQEMIAKSHDCGVDIAGLEAGAYELVVDAGRLDGPSLTERMALELP